MNTKTENQSFLAQKPKKIAKTENPNTPLI